MRPPPDDDSDQIGGTREIDARLRAELGCVFGATPNATVRAAVLRRASRIATRAALARTGLAVSLLIGVTAWSDAEERRLVATATTDPLAIARPAPDITALDAELVERITARARAAPTSRRSPPWSSLSFRPSPEPRS